MIPTLTPHTLVSPREKTYFVVALVLSIATWGVLTIFTCGTLWIGLAIMGAIVWLSHGLLIAGLRADAIEVHKDQLARLDAAFREVCSTLGLNKVPDLYVIQSGGALNAFATRHTGRHFVVIFSDMLEALGPDSREMRFLLGHEIGHIQRNHLTMRMLLAPALFLPLIGPAYSRACETTCDRYGAFAAGDTDNAMRAMMTLAGGKYAGKEMDPHHFAEQNKNRRGFFVSWYELISGYPTLSRRVRDLRQLAGERVEPSAVRNPLAYLFALVTFGGGFGGRGSMISTLMFVYLVAIMFAIATPAIEGASKRAKLEQIRREQALQQESASPSDQQQP